ncbi:MAG: DUF1080 domain-containing protein [Rhodopirellula sp.]|nr:DUF1080 domain-containing protein [Rhodopirellula sp.]
MRFRAITANLTPPLLVLALAVPLSADSADGKTKLFDGQSLAGWQVTGCEVKVEDEAILLVSGNGLVRTDKQYGDFILELEWKALRTEMWDSGIFFRCELPSQQRPWPKDYQVNLRKGMEGNVQNLQGAASEGLVKSGEWNHFKLTVLGETAALEINGRPAWKAVGVARPTGYIALQAEVPGGGQFLFRDIEISAPAGP